MQRPFRTIPFIFVFLIACAAGDIKPVPIEDHDSCSFCRMAISERQFAAEIITTDETVLKFDDIGCMLRYQKASGDKLKPAAMFVMDYDSRQWLKARKAFFKKSTTIKTPMGSGIVAHDQKSKAGSDGLTFDALVAAEK